MAIKWKEVSLETRADDGIVLKGIIRYWDKDYSIMLTEPIEAKIGGAHLMYMIPTKFIVDKNIPDKAIKTEPCGTSRINLYYVALERLKKFYEERK